MESRNPSEFPLIQSGVDVDLPFWRVNMKGLFGLFSIVLDKLSLILIPSLKTSDTIM